MNELADAAEDANRELKTATRAMWALGDYHRFATETVWEIGPVLVEACGISAGQRVLDVATGTGTWPSVPPRPARRSWRPTSPRCRRPLATHASRQDLAGTHFRRRAHPTSYARGCDFSICRSAAAFMPPTSGRCSRP